MMKANQDIRDYMSDHCVTQSDLAEAAGLSLWSINRKLQTELSQQGKERFLILIDSIVAARKQEAEVEEPKAEETADVSLPTKFQIGDRVKIPAKQDVFGAISDIWSSLAQDRTMYEVTLEGNGTKGLYAENQLEPAPVPTSYSFEAIIEGNVAVVTMTATQGEKTYIYARGHAHILHDGEVGMAQAISFASKRMFESLDEKQENRIYVR